MIDWQPAYPGEPQERATVKDMVFLSAGANSSGGRRSIDGRDTTGRFPWSAYVFRSISIDLTGHADTLDEAKRAAVEAAKQILRAALDECGDD